VQGHGVGDGAVHVEEVSAEGSCGKRQGHGFRVPGDGPTAALGWGPFSGEQGVGPPGCYF
jgi:hypothetical protein